MKRNIIVLFLFNFFRYYLTNYIVGYIPFYTVRHFYYRKLCHVTMGTGSSIHMGCFINKFNIIIGKNTAINRNCYLDGRGGLTIGDNVSVSPEVHLITATHDLNSANFDYIEKEVKINDYAWIGTRAIVLPGVELGKGCVVASGAVVTKSVDNFTIVGGVPAKVIGKRNQDLNYNCKWMPPFD